MAKTDKNYTAIKMEEKTATVAGHDFEEPFDEDFWLKVRMFVAFECKLPTRNICFGFNTNLT